MAIERQEIHCHNCNQYVQFDLDTSLDGNHVLDCPNCGHQHCRVVRQGRITDGRWDSRNGWGSAAIISVSTGTMTTSSNSTYSVYTNNSASVVSTGTFLYCSWTTAASANSAGNW